MSNYEEKQAARRARLESAADAASTASQRLLTSARKMSNDIPFGQPILRGHHSESRDRAYRARIHNKQDKGFALMDKAKYLREKAASIGKGGISSDDPTAVDKLRAELERAEKQQNLMKRANVFVRKNDRAGLALLGFTEQRIDQLFTKDFAGRIGFPTYILTNNGANIRRIKMRIADLETHAVRETVEVKTQAYTYREDTTENRVMFEFDGKPDEATRNLLKSYSFKWSPSRGAWVRQLNRNGVYAAECVRKFLDPLL